MLFCRVTLGKSFLQFSTMKMAHAPPGHHSVIGRPSVNGLAYAEYVIYRGEQVGGLARPGFIEGQSWELEMGVAGFQTKCAVITLLITLLFFFFSFKWGNKQ